MATQTLAPTWTPTSCPASTDLYEIRVAPDDLFFFLGPLTATSDCAPLSYTPASPYYAASCPTSYTSACAHGLFDKTTVCCPDARSMSCTEEPWIYNSLPFSCVEVFTSTYTAIFTTTSVFSGASEGTGTETVTLTPNYDAVNAFGLEYIPMITTSGPTPTSTGATTTVASSPTNSAASSTIPQKSSGSSLSGGAIAGIVVGVVAFIVILALVWNRKKIVALIHRKTAPQPGPTVHGLHSNVFQPGPGQYHNVYSAPPPIIQPLELESTREPAELPANFPVAGRGT